jgi:hypothetical protein
VAILSNLATHHSVAKSARQETDRFATLHPQNLAQNREIVTRFLDETDLREVVGREISQRIYEEVRAGA